MKTDVSELICSLSQNSLMIATAESCTGGLIAKLITDAAGASAAFAGGVVSYANEVKINALGVDADVLRENGAVSEPVALAMADGARSLCRADIAVSTTGIAGPGGGTEEKPVGTVWVAVSCPRRREAVKLSLPQSWTREQIREAAADFALALAKETVKIHYGKK